MEEYNERDEPVGSVITTTPDSKSCPWWDWCGCDICPIAGDDVICIRTVGGGITLSAYYGGI